VQKNENFSMDAAVLKLRFRSVYSHLSWTPGLLRNSEWDGGVWCYFLIFRSKPNLGLESFNIPGEIGDGRWGKHMEF